MGLRHPVHQELVSGKFDLQKVPLQPMCLDCIFVLNTWRQRKREKQEREGRREGERVCDSTRVRKSKRVRERVRARESERAGKKGSAHAREREVACECERKKASQRARKEFGILREKSLAGDGVLRESERNLASKREVWRVARGKFGVLAYCAREAWCIGVLREREVWCVAACCSKGDIS